MKLPQILALVFLTSALCACGTDSALGRAEQSCIKYPTPTARTECEQKERADSQAFEKEIQKNKAEAKARADAELQAQASAGDGRSDAKSDTGDATKPEAKKKSGLCFKRAATGEMVCPN